MYYHDVLLEGLRKVTKTTPTLPSGRESKHDITPIRSTDDISLDHGVRLDVNGDDAAADDDV
jgi:hypothetical protein